jgi:anti-sigma B factor antagonist
MDHPYTVQQIDGFTIVELQTPSLLDPVLLADLGDKFYHLVDEEDRRLLVLDFDRVQYMSSQAIGIVITLQKKLAALPHGRLILCGVGEKLSELIKITRLDRILTIKPSQKEAIKVPKS